MITSYGYSLTHRVLTSVTDPRGNQTVYQYGTVCNQAEVYPTRIIRASGRPEARTTDLVYDCDSGKVTSRLDADNNVWASFQYDALGRMTSDSEGNNMRRPARCERWLSAPPPPPPGAGGRTR